MSFGPIALMRVKWSFVVAVLVAAWFCGEPRAIAQTGDVVVASNQTFAAGTYNLTSLTVQSGAVLTIAAPSTVTVAGATLVTGNSQIVLQSVNTTAQVNGVWAGAGSTVKSGSVQVDAGSSINADSQGYAPASPSNINVPAAGPGGGGINHSNSGGGSYGGFAGGIPGSGPGGNVIYGSVTAPVDLGSGGSCGFGGGTVRLIVTGALTNNGMVSANGGSKAAYGCSGGAGGSVYVTTQTLTGAGSFTANGGDGNTGSGVVGGGGGRVALEYADAGAFTASGCCTTNGGKGGPAAPFTFYPSGFNSNGASGTVLFANTSTLSKTLTVSQDLTLPNNSLTTYGAVNVQNGATLTLGGGSSLYVAGGITVSGNSNIVVGSVNNAAQVNGTWAGAGSTITAQTVQVDQGSTINTDGQGYASGNNTAGAGPGGGQQYGSGGSYGGGGVNGNGGEPITSNEYGVRFAPVELGSGGYVYSGAVTKGGGALKLVVTDTLTNNGRISSNAGASPATGGAAAGGSVFVMTQTLAGSGSFNANSGGGTAEGGIQGGGGGRVAVYYSDSSDFTYAGYSGTTASGGPAQSFAGDTLGTVEFFDTGIRSQLGIVTFTKKYDKKGNPVADYIPPYTDFASYGAQSIAVVGGDTLIVGGGSTINLSGFLTVTQNSTVQLQSVNNTGKVNGVWAGLGVGVSAQTLQVDAGSSLNADGQGYTADAGPGAIPGPGSTAGGSYGGQGGRLNGANSPDPSLEYGTARQPVDLGSGGWNYAGAAGNGGGLVRVVVSGTTTLNGSMSANGATGSSYAGSGSGGTVYLTTGTLTGAGSFQATGGSANDGNASGGGGGRVYVDYKNASGYTGFPATSASGGTAVNYPGTAGTVAFVNTFTDTGGNSASFGALMVDQPYTIPANTTATFDSITVMNGATLTVGGGSTLAVTGAISVSGKSQILLQSINNSAQVNGKWAGQGSTLSAASVNVENGSSINADGLGYTPNSGPGAEQGPYSTSGGSYGGIGGSRDTANGLYGDPTTPMELGSGGWTYTGQAGNGGGLVQLTVSGAVVNNGTISANGTVPPTAGSYAGGGSGGAVFVRAGSVSGAGIFTATGGSAISTGAGGGGGGGRVAVYAPSTTGFTGFTGSVVSGGTGSYGGGAGTTGTVGFFDTSTSTPSLATYQRFTLPAAATTSFTNLTATNGATLVVGGQETVNVAGTLLITGNSTVEVDSINNLAQVNSAWAGKGSVFNAANLQVDAGSSFRADKQGYGIEDGPGAISGPGSTAGGSYGGGGGRSGSDGGITTSYEYGSETMPVDLGSGGWNYSGNGGFGGGAIQMNVSGTLTLNGTVSANGGDSSSYAGSGSGGSIFVTAAKLTGSGAFQANGGSGLDNNGANSGGGGGRIAVYSPALTGYTGASSSSVAGGMSGSALPGSQGTLAFFDTSVPNNNVSIYGGYNLAPNSNTSFNNLTVAQGANVQVGGGAQVLVAQTLRLAGTMTAQSINNTGMVNGKYAGKGVSILANTAQIDATGVITADAQGYAIEFGPGAEPGPYTSAGGSYGGAGGARDNLGTYGSATLPIDLGSGGWQYAGNAGAGGGAIELLVAGNLTLNGMLTANGSASTGNAGGGAGGSVFVAANTVTGTGSITANGGSNSAKQGGGGGGGRVSLLYAAPSSFAKSAITAMGGTNSLNGADGTVNFQQQVYSQWILPVQPAIHDTAQLEWFSDAGGATSVSLVGPRTQQIANGANAISTASFDTKQFPDGAYQLRLSVLGSNGQVLQIVNKDEVINNSVLWHSGTLTANTEWSAGKVHALDGDVIVPSGVTLTVDAGAIVKALPGVSILVQSGGTLNAMGTAGAPVIFTTFDDSSVGGNTDFNAGISVPTPGEWQGIIVLGTGTLNSNDNTQILYTQALLSGTLSGNQSLLGTRVYTITSPLTVPSGVTLNIQPGAVVKFGQGAGIVVQQGGVLNASGTLAQPIYMTSVSDSSVGGVTPGSDGSLPIAGDWNSIEIDGGTATFNYVHLLYGGGPQNASAQAGMIETGRNAQVTVSNSELAHAFFIGLQTGYPNGGGDNVTVTNTIFHDNEDRAINTLAGSIVHVVNDTFDSNAAGVFNHGGTVDVENSVVTNSSSAQFGGIGICCGGTFSNLSYNNSYTSVTGVANYVGLNDPTGTKGNISKAPVYMNAPLFDFRPTYGSPMIDAADATVGNYPALDIFGDVRYNSPLVTAKTGKPDANGKYPDMGAFEFVQTAPSDLDLTVSKVDGPRSAIVGSQVTLTWTDTNIGAGTAAGPWHDAIYLVSGTGANQVPVFAGNVLVGQGTTLGNGATLAATGTVTVPGTPVGSYRWEVRANVLGEVLEGANTANNTSDSLDTVAIDLQQIVPGGSMLTGSFAGDGATSYYKVNPSPTQTTQVQLALDNSGGGAVELFVGSNYVPTPQHHDYVQPQFDASSVSVIIPAGAQQTYYVAAYAQNLTTAPAAFTVSASPVSFSLTSVTPGSVPNTGDHTFTFVGGGFTSLTQFSLSDAAGDTLLPTAVFIADAAHANVTFHFNTYVGSGAITTQGAYSAVATNGNSVQTLPDAVQVVSAIGSGVNVLNDLKINLDVPQAFRAGFPAILTVNYTNISGVDIAAPIMAVQATGAVLAEIPPDCATCSSSYAAQYASTFTSGLVLAINHQGPAGTLPAGASGSIQFMATPTGSSGSTSFAATELVGDIVGTQFYELRNPPVGGCTPGTPCTYPYSPVPVQFGNYASAAAFCAALVVPGQGAAGNSRACMQMLNNAGYTYTAPPSGLQPISSADCLSNPYCTPHAVQDLNYIQGHLTVAQLRKLLAIDASAMSDTGDYEYDLQKVLAFELNKDGIAEFNNRYHQGAFGYGSGDSFGITGDMASGAPTLHYSDGSTQTFPTASSTAGVYLGALGDSSTLTVQTDGSWLVQAQDGTAIHLVSNGQNFQLDSIADRNGNKSTYTYANGSLLKVQDGYSNTLAYSYDALGHVTSTTDNYGYTQTFNYLTLADTARSTFLSSITTPVGTTSFTYQTGGTHGPGYIDDACILTYCELPIALTAIAFPDGTHQSFTYDPAGRLASSSGDQNSATLAYSYGADGSITLTDANGGVTRVERNVFGSVAAVTDPLGAKTTVKYDAEGKPVSLLGALGDSAASGYDNAGNLNAATSSRGSRVTAGFNAANLPTTLTDPMQSLTSYGYDSRFNPTSEQNPDGSQRTVAYNSNGLITTRTNARGQTQTFLYDSKGRLATKTLSTGTQLQYSYDNNNRLLSVASAAGTETFSYDDSGRTTGITHGNGTSVKYTYNALGQLTGQTDSAGFSLTYTYDALGRLSSVISGANTIASYTYDKLNRILMQKMGNGTATQLSYDLAGNITGIKHLNAASATLGEYDYTYDAEGAVLAATLPTGTAQFSYDLDHQLTAAAGAADDVQYTYDASGNRTSSVTAGATTSYSPNNLNQYSSAGAHSYRYDLDGNLVADNTTTYTYDEENRLTGITNGADTWTFVYDALGQRQSVTHNGQTTSYIMGIGSVEAAVTAGSTEHYAYGYGLLAALGSDGSQDFYHFDNNGNTVLITDQSGAAINSYSYLPFGEKTTLAAKAGNPFTFSGQLGVVDDGTGLYHMRNRWYSPALGRFLQQDPVGTSGGVNKYVYVSNSPTNLVDPKGLCGAYVTGNVSAGVPVLGKVSLGLSVNLQTGDIFFGGGGSPGLVATPEANAYVGAGYVADSTTAADNTGDCGDQVNNVLDGQSGSVAVTAPGGLTVTQVGGSSGGATEIGLNVGTKQVTGGVSAGIGSSNKIGRVPILRFSDENFARDREVDETRNWIQWKKNAQRVRDGHIPLVLVPLCPTCLSKTTPNPTIVPVRGAIDPNGKMTSGYGDNGFVPTGAAVTYTIFFENQPTATAPAQKVTVTDQLSASFDWSTVQLTSITFNNATLTVPAGTQTYASQASVASDPNPVKVTAALSPATGKLVWTLQSVDPITQGTPANPLAGFLPPNNAANSGVGSVTFTVVPKMGLNNTATITNQASIVFDANAPIATNTVTNTLDSTTPTSAINPLPASMSSSIFTVGWTGTDPSGSGIASYNIYVAADGGMYSLWLSGTTATSATFTGITGHSYSFVSLATNNVGTSQTTPGTAQTTTVVSATGAKVTVVPAASTIAQNQPLNVTVSVAGQPAPTGSIVLSSTMYSSGTVVLASGTATVTIPAGTLPLGTDTLTATYTPDLSSGGIYAGGSGTAAVLVTAPATPVASVNPSSLTFSTAAGSTSAKQTVTLTNSGAAPLNISGISLSGANSASFAQTNTCGTSLAAGGTCSISVTFAPAAAGNFVATLNVADNASGSPQAVALSGTATAAPAAVVSLNPGALTFSAVVGSAGAAQTVTLTNTGNAPLTISGINLSGANAANFAQTNTCGASLAASGTCSISITFAPAAAGNFVATLNVADNASGSPQTVALSGTASNAPVAVASLSPGALTFTAMPGTTAAAQTVTLTNTGKATLSLTGIAITGINAATFAQTNTCGASIAPGAACTIQVVFTPSTVGSFTAALAVSDNAAASPQSIPLSGMTPAPPTFTLSVTPASQSVSRGAVATYLVTVTPQGGAFTQTVTFSIAGEPAGVTPVFSPGSVVPGIGPVTSTLTIPTSTLLGSLQDPEAPGGSGWPGAPLLACGVLLLASMRKHHKRLTRAVMFLAFLIVSIALTGCGNSPRTITLVVSATSPGSGAVPAETEHASATLVVRF